MTKMDRVILLLEEVVLELRAIHGAMQPPPQPELPESPLDQIARAQSAADLRQSGLMAGRR